MSVITYLGIALRGGHWRGVGGEQGVRPHNNFGRYCCNTKKKFRNYRDITVSLAVLLS